MFSCWNQRVQTLLESHNLERHVTGGQDKNADSVKYTETQWNTRIQIIAKKNSH